jgi:hypothetical protein
MTYGPCSSSLGRLAKNGMASPLKTTCAQVISIPAFSLVFSGDKSCRHAWAERAKKLTSMQAVIYSNENKMQPTNPNAAT